MKIGSTEAMIIESKDDIRRFIAALGLDDVKTIIVKPNWVDPNDGTHTDAKILDWLISSLGCDIKIVESYTTWRNEKYLKQNNWPKQPIDPSHGCLGMIDKNIEWIREQDNWFMESSGIGKILKKHDVEYINVTEEVISGKTVPAKKISESLGDVELKNKELLGFIPTKLYDLKGSVLISLGKVKADGNNVVTLSTKNLFGMIPDPSRWPKYHGYKDELLFNNIIDINKIYRALFDVVYINEGVFTAMEGPWPMEINPVYGWKRMIGGREAIEVDSLTAYMMGVLNVEEIPLLQVAKNDFGEFRKELLDRIPQELIKPLKFW